MINWENIQYSATKAREDYSNLEILPNKIVPINLALEFNELRDKLIMARDKIYDEHGFDSQNEVKYSFDLLFGIQLFSILRSDPGFTNRAASNDSVWRYLSVKVIPDIVHSRWGMNEDHFFNMSRRIWLKTIYWYINLSWTGTDEGTYNLLKYNSTDTIQNLVERPGLGYDITLYRELMKQYSFHKHDVDLFRRVMKLNTARIVVSSPSLYKGGIKGYVENLFNTASEGI